MNGLKRNRKMVDKDRRDLVRNREKKEVHNNRFTGNNEQNTCTNK